MNVDIYFIAIVMLCLIIISLIIILATRIAVTIDNFRKTIAQKYIPFDPSTDKLVSLATDVWRLNKIVQKLEDSLDDNDKRRIKNSLNRISTYLSSSNIDIEDFAGRKYNDGMNIEILSTEYSDDVDYPMISQVNRPQVSYTGIIHQKAQVIISRPPLLQSSGKSKRRQHPKKAKKLKVSKERSEERYDK